MVFIVLWEDWTHKLLEYERVYNFKIKIACFYSLEVNLESMKMKVKQQKN